MSARGNDGSVMARGIALFCYFVGRLLGGLRFFFLGLDTVIMFFSSFFFSFAMVAGVSGCLSGFLSNYHMCKKGIHYRAVSSHNGGAVIHVLVHFNNSYAICR